MLDEETGEYYIEYVKSAPIYYGQTKNGARHGKGRMTWPNGNVYDGLWENGRANGYGELSINDENDPEKFGNRYLGEWKNDLKHGVMKKISLTAGKRVRLKRESTVRISAMGSASPGSTMEGLK